MKLWVMAMASFVMPMTWTRTRARAFCLRLNARSAARTTATFNWLMCGEIHSNVNFTKSFWQHNTRRSSTHQPGDQMFCCCCCCCYCLFQMPLLRTRTLAYSIHVSGATDDVCVCVMRPMDILYSNTLLFPIDLYRIILDRRRLVELSFE